MNPVTSSAFSNDMDGCYWPTPADHMLWSNMSARDPLQPVDSMEKSTPIMQPIRLAVALIFAPFAAPAVTILLMVGGDWPTNDSGFIWVFGFGSAFGYLGLLLAGIPILMALRRLQQLNLIALTIAGAIAGVVVFQFSLFVLALLLESTGGYDLLTVVYGALAGASVACCFGLIAGVENLRSGTTDAEL